MNIFEDLCGMTTLGSLEVDPIIILDCSKVALQISKDVTRRVREAFSHRLSIRMLDFTLSSAKRTTPIQAISEENKRHADAFLKTLLSS
jgi:hypothetical protein